MNNLERIMKKIDRLRKTLTKTIESNENLVDPKVVKASKLLDKALNEYNYKIFGGLR